MQLSPTSENDALDPQGFDVVFYDGTCGFCDRFVQFVLTRDPSKKFRFAPLQGELAARRLPPLGGDPAALETVFVLCDGGQLLARSRAVFHVLKKLGGSWAVLGYLGAVVPTVIADLGYRFVARVRYRLFGRVDSCRLPRAQERSRFLA